MTMRVDTRWFWWAGGGTRKTNYTGSYGIAGGWVESKEVDSVT